MPSHRPWCVACAMVGVGVGHYCTQGHHGHLQATLEGMHKVCHQLARRVLGHTLATNQRKSVASLP